MVFTSRTFGAIGVGDDLVMIFALLVAVNNDPNQLAQESCHRWL
jgi:hypothetical protein